MNQPIKLIIVCRQQYGRENVILSDIVKAPSSIYDDGASDV